MASVAILTNDARARRSQRPTRIVAYIETHVLILPTSYACSLARFVTTSLCSATVSQALRQPLRAGGLLETFLAKPLITTPQGSRTSWTEKPPPTLVTCKI